VGPKASLNDFRGKVVSPPSPGFEPQTVQTIASRYTDYAISAPSNTYQVMVTTGMLGCFHAG
jgi:hypothetical protein